MKQRTKGKNIGFLALLAVFLLLCVCGCNDSYVHTHNLKTREIPATCSKEGCFIYECYECGLHTVEVIPIPESGGHNYENYVCTECDDFLRDEAPETDSLQYRKTKDENGEIVYMVMGVTERVPYIKIPTTHEGIPVAQIFFKAFYNDLNIKHVVLPESITFIDDRAFECCFSLLSINIPDSVTFIGKSAFSNCKIKNVSLASLTSVENFTFLGCGGLTNVVIPRGITTIGIAAFAGCSSLVELVIPDSVTEIGPEAFGDCSKLTSVTIPISIDWFGPGLFRRNYDLQDIFYEGTIEQWHAIQRAVGIFDTGEDAAWDALTGDYTVHCSDGDIPKAQATNP